MLTAKILIPNYRCIEPKGGSKPYHVYSVHVNVFLNGSSKIYFVERRYSDFLQLHNTIRRQYETPDFPPKRVRNSRVKVLESRRLALERYLQIMTDLTPIPREIINFLEMAHPAKDYLPINYWKSEQPSWSMEYGDSSEGLFRTATGSSDVYINPAAAFFEDPFIDSDSSSNLSDSITRGVLDALYHS